MLTNSAQLARSITRKSSKQSFFTACFLVDKDLVDDCLKAYAYFRWADDVVDESSRSRSERIAFIKRQKDLIADLYQRKQVDRITQEEELVTDLVQSDRRENSGLKSFIDNFMAVIEFDAQRKGRLISADELKWYASRLGIAVTDAIQYFVCNEHVYPDSENRYSAAAAAHITHMLRDMRADITEGYINIPAEYINEHVLNLEDVSDPAFQAWVRNRVEQAREMFFKGKQYLDQLIKLRCKIAGYWYCARFEKVLDIIEQDDYILRTSYDQRRGLSNWFKIAALTITVTIRHLIASLLNDGDECIWCKIFNRRETI